MPRLKKEQTELVNFKIKKDEKKAIMAKAKKYAGGNLSFWLRYAALHFVPSKKDLA